METFKPCKYLNVLQKTFNVNPTAAVSILFSFGYFELRVYTMTLSIKSVLLYHTCVHLLFYGISLVLMNSNDSTNARVMKVKFVYGNG